MIKLVIAFILFLGAFIAGCATTEPKRFGPDHYDIERVDRETWIVSEHGRGKLGGECN